MINRSQVSWRNFNCSIGGFTNQASVPDAADPHLLSISASSGYTNIENTVRYLSVDVDDALTLSERTDIQSNAGIRHVEGRQMARTVESFSSGVRRDSGIHLQLEHRD